MRIECPDWDAIRQELRQVSSLILVRLLPWAGALTATAVEEQLLAFGEKAWCERMWIQDCKNHNHERSVPMNSRRP